MADVVTVEPRHGAVFVSGTVTDQDLDCYFTLLSAVPMERRPYIVLTHPTAAGILLGYPCEIGPRVGLRLALPRLPRWVLAMMPSGGTISGVCGG